MSLTDVLRRLSFTRPKYRLLTPFLCGVGSGTHSATCIIRPNNSVEKNVEKDPLNVETIEKYSSKLIRPLFSRRNLSVVRDLSVESYRSDDIRRKSIAWVRGKRVGLAVAPMTSADLLPLCAYNAIDCCGRRGRHRGI